MAEPVVVLENLGLRVNRNGSKEQCIHAALLMMGERILHSELFHALIRG